MAKTAMRSAASSNYRKALHSVLSLLTIDAASVWSVWVYVPPMPCNHAMIRRDSRWWKPAAINAACAHAACPEEAIELVPRLLLDVEAIEKPEVLHEMEPFNCVECGRPFASEAMVSRVQEKLKGHWMYKSDKQIRRLQMCRTCRTTDALTTGDYFR